MKGLGQGRAGVIAGALSLAVAVAPACGSSDEGEGPVCDVELPAPGDGRLSAQGGVLRDSLGRRVLLRGLNAGGRAKLAPYAPFDFPEGGYQQALDAYLDRAASWGIDALRVPFSWAAVEPSAGAIDEAYLARYDALLDSAWKRRIWTVVDFHQDIYAEALCGDGFPDWTLPAPPKKVKHDCPSWYLSYNDAEVKAAFDAFWAAKTPAREGFRAVWRLMARRHRERAGVVGFEILNEPAPGSAERGAWEREVFSPFLQEMADQIRADAPGALVFVDVPGDAFLGGRTEVTPPSGPGVIFAPHYYEPLAFVGLQPGLDGVRKSLERWRDVASGWGVPLLLGETGVRTGKDFTGPLAGATYDAADALSMSVTYWEYSASAETWNHENFGVVGTDGAEVGEVLDQLARPYPRAVAGGEPSFSYDAQSRVFHLSFDAQAGGVTEVAVPRRAYPGGVAAAVSGGCARQQGDALLVKSEAGGRVELTMSAR